MRGYFDIVRSTTASVHFVFEEKPENIFLQEIKVELQEKQIVIAYVSVFDLQSGVSPLCRRVGEAIGAEHALAQMEDSFVVLFDDMVSLSEELPGLVIVVDEAWTIFEKDQVTVLGFVEGFLAQLHHWLKKNKPCHLCFQMSPNKDVQRCFG